ncbi:hypothetical protein AMTRI_Chr06g177290 [Amborella trichopoda]
MVYSLNFGVNSLADLERVYSLKLFFFFFFFSGVTFMVLLLLCINLCQLKERLEREMEIKRVRDELLKKQKDSMA